MPLAIAPFYSGQTDYIDRLNDIIDQAGATVDLSGYATLVAGKVPASQLPSYVDDVTEFANLAGFPATGATGIIYVALDSNKIYRWSGSAYIEIATSTTSSGPYFISAWIGYVPAASEILLRHKFTVPVAFPANLTGSVIDVLDNPTVDTSISIKKISGATTTYVAVIGVTTAGVITVVVGSAFDYAVGDVMEVVAASTADATFGRLGFTLVGTH